MKQTTHTRDIERDIYIYTHTYTYIYAHTHAHTYIYIHAYMGWKPCTMMWWVFSDINKMNKGKKEIEIKNRSKTLVGIDGARLMKDTSRFSRI